MQIESLDMRGGGLLPLPPSGLPLGVRAPAPPRAAPLSPASRPPEGRALPCRFGRYTLFDHIGQGGMADIYLAQVRTDLGAARLVVIKEVAPKLAHNERFAEMLASEAKLAAELRHANVVQVEDLGREGGSLFIAMEYVEGFDLRELLRRCARERVALPVEFSLLVITEVLRALVYAHRKGVVHRDVSPSNVLLSFDGEIKLCDFGIARAHDLVDLPPDEALQGKAGYMSPEHASGEPVDERSDVFAVGILLWELLAGRRMYSAPRGPGAAAKAEAREALLKLAQRAEIPPLPERGLPDEGTLHAIVGRALEPRRDDRYPSAAVMLRDLTAYVATSNMVASPLRFGAFLRDSFGTDVVTFRRARQRAMRALELGPPAVITPIAPPVAPVASPPAAPPEETSAPESFAPESSLPEESSSPESSLPEESSSPESSLLESFASERVSAEPPSPWSLRPPAHEPPPRTATRRLLARCAVALAIVAPGVAWYLASR